MIDGPELPPDVARLEGLSGEWQGMDYQAIVDYMSGARTVTVSRINGACTSRTRNMNSMMKWMTYGSTSISNRSAYSMSGAFAGGLHYNAFSPE